MRKVLRFVLWNVLPLLVVLIFIKLTVIDVQRNAARDREFQTAFGMAPPTSDTEAESYQTIVVDVLDSLHFDVVRTDDLNKDRRDKSIPWQDKHHYEMLSIAYRLRYNRAIDLALEYHVPIGSHRK